MVFGCASGLVLLLLRSRSFDDFQFLRFRKSILDGDSGRFVLANVGAGNACNHRCISSHHFWNIFSNFSSCDFGIFSIHKDQAHIETSFGSNLRPGCQLVAIRSDKFDCFDISDKFGDWQCIRGHHRGRWNHCNHTIL